MMKWSLHEPQHHVATRSLAEGEAGSGKTLTAKQHINVSYQSHRLCSVPGRGGPIYFSPESRVREGLRRVRICELVPRPFRPGSEFQNRRGDATRDGEIVQGVDALREHTSYHTVNPAKAQVVAQGRVGDNVSL